MAFAPLACSHGVDFVAITERSLDGPSGQTRISDFYFPALRRIAHFFQQTVHRSEASLVVNIDKTAGSNLCCERYGLPAVRVHLSPLKLRSLERPPVPFLHMFGGPLALDRERLARFFQACDEHSGLVSHINACRRQLSLSPVLSAATRESHVAEEVCLFPDWFAPAATDWPTVRHLGFALPKSRRPLSVELENFLEAGSPPVVFTTGTSVHEVLEFFQHARCCLEKTGRRGLFLSPHLEHYAGTPNIHCESFAELGGLLPRASLLVHHGGVGTLARAVEAGVPQIISPLSYDQPDNAHRIERLGLGVALPREQLSGGTLAEGVEHLLSPSWTRVALRAAHESTAACDGASELAIVLERCAERFRGAPSGWRTASADRSVG
jgi:rhamnosyltransferase subunit B